MDRRLGLRLQGCRVRAIAGHGVVSTGALTPGLLGFQNPETTPPSIPTTPRTAPNASVLSTRNLSRSESDHRPLAGLDAVSSFMVARKARASFIGRVVAFCSEKSCRSTPTVGPAIPLRVRSTKKESERTSALKSEFTCGSELANRTVAG